VFYKSQIGLEFLLLIACMYTLPIKRVPPSMFTKWIAQSVIFSNDCENKAPSLTAVKVPPLPSSRKLARATEIFAARDESPVAISIEGLLLNNLSNNCFFVDILIHIEAHRIESKDKNVFTGCCKGQRIWPLCS